MKKITFVLLLLIFQTSKSQCWQQLAAGGDHSVAIKSDGTLWTWGRNNYGQLGDGTLIDKNIPVQIGTASDWAFVDATTFRTMAIKTDGSLWGWGYNNYGQIGDGNFGIGAYASVPVAVGNDTDWIKISLGLARTFALKNDGSLWGWGSGLLGDGVDSEHHIPFRIGNATDWTTIATGDSGTLAIKTDHSLWAWGTNNHGELGVGNFFNNFPSIVQAANNSTDWLAVKKAEAASSLMIKTDGTLWAMGSNALGNVGDNGAPNVVLPSQISTNTTWSAIACNNYHSAAIKSNGELWTWGYNVAGELGDGTLINKAVPTQVASGISWLSVATGDLFTIGISTNHTLYAWGDNTYGQLGDGTNTNKSLPVQIGQTCTLGTQTFSDKNRFLFYPNPVKNAGFVDYTLDYQDVVYLSISNNLGQVIFESDAQGQPGTNHFAVDFAGYSAGIYMVTIRTSKQHNTLKVIRD